MKKRDFGKPSWTQRDRTQNGVVKFSRKRRLAAVIWQNMRPFGRQS
jgi:hypothetical protein